MVWSKGKGMIFNIDEKNEEFWCEFLFGFSHCHN